MQISLNEAPLIQFYIVHSRFGPPRTRTKETPKFNTRLQRRPFALLQYSGVLKLFSDFHSQLSNWLSTVFTVFFFFFAKISGALYLIELTRREQDIREIINNDNNIWMSLNAKSMSRLNLIIDNKNAQSLQGIRHEGENLQSVTNWVSLGQIINNLNVDVVM